MRDRYVIDTNVLIAASAADPTQPKDIDATPDDPAERMRVWAWLSEFHDSLSRIVLDFEGGIFKEYNKKLGFNDFGIQVVMHKWNTAAVDNVEVGYDVHGHGVLKQPLFAVIHDAADKKFVAASLDALDKYGDSCIAFAGDTDWHDWEDELLNNGLLLEPIIENWSRHKHAQKKSR